MLLFSEGYSSGTINTVEYSLESLKKQKIPLRI